MNTPDNLFKNLKMKLPSIITILVVVVLSTTSVLPLALPCVRKSFGGSSFVCVCNDTYCDTVADETPLPVNQFAVYSSSKNGDRLRKSVHELSKSYAADLRLFVNTSDTVQTILGFGGTFTDASGINIASLPTGAQKNLIESYFGSSGIEYTLGRIPIASNDMSVGVYSYDFTQGDTGLAKFTIDENDHLYKIPFIDQAVGASRHNVSLYGSPWSPPEWMKTNDNMVGFGTIDPSMIKVYANYMARFLSEYEGFMLKGRMWGLTTQSGPTRSCSNSSKPVYQSLCWTPETVRDWIVKDLIQSLIDAGYGHIKLFTMDDNRDVLDEWDNVISGSAAEKGVDGYAIQGYHDNTSSESLCKVFNKYHGKKFLLGSEFCIRDTPTVDLGSWERAEILARRIFQDLLNCMSGFTDYNIAVSMSGGPSWINNTADSPIVVDSKLKQFYKQPMFYTMGQFSKFIHPNSIAVEITSSQRHNIDNPSVAFQRPDGSTVVVVGNFAPEQTTVEIKFVNSEKVARFYMDANSINSFTFL